MKRILLPLAVLIVLGVLGLVAWLGLRGDSGARTGPDATAAVAPGDHAVLDPHAPRTDDLSAPTRDVEGLDRASAANGSRPSLGGPVLTVDVRAPQDCDLDEHAEVYALRREADIDALQVGLGPRAPGDGDAGASAAVVLAHAKVGPDNRARLELPAGTKHAHVILAGRSWFTRDTIEVDVRGSNPVLALQAECGGWIAGRATLPAGSSASAPDGETAGLRLSLASMGANMFGGGGGRRGGGGGGFGGAFARTERRARVAGGSFEFWALDPAQGYTLEFVPERFSAVQMDVPEIVAGRGTAVSLSLTAGGTISGRVTDDAGTGVAGAEVEARVAGVMFGVDDRIVRRTQADAEGRYVLPAVAAGSVQVSARAPAHLAAEARTVDAVEAGSVAGVDFTLATGASVTGVVNWADGTPAAGAEVLATAERSLDRGGDRGAGPGGFDARAMRQMMRRPEEVKAVADAQGRFTLRGLPEGKVTVSAERVRPEDEAAVAAAATKSSTDRADVRARNEAQRKLAWRAKRAGVATGTADTVLVLTPPLVVRGTVTAANDGTPVKSFVVRAQVAGGGRGGFGGPFGGAAAVQAGPQRVEEDCEDARGEFVLGGLREGRWRVSVAADGFAAVDAVEVELPLAADAKPLAFALPRAGSIRGLVRGPRGEPVAGAIVGGPPQGGGMFGGGRGGGGGGAGNTPDVPRVRTDANGAFVMEGLTGGRVILVADSKSWARSEEVTVDVTAGAVADGVVLTMRAGGTVTGELYEDGRAAAGRTITALDMRTFTNASTRTDAGGRFVLEHLLAGTWTITALPSAGDMSRADPASGDGPMRLFSQMKSQTVDVVDGQEAHVVLGAAPAAKVTVHGKVTQGGVAVAGTRVTFLGEGQSFGPGMKAATTGDDGSYAIDLDRAGDYSVTVQTGGGGRMNMLEFVETIPQRADVVLDLALPTARVSGHVRTPDGAAASNVTVTLQPSRQVVGGSMTNGGLNVVQTDGEGAFDLNSLRAGTYVLSVGGRSFGGFRGPGGGGGGGDATYGKKTIDVKLDEGEWRRDVDVRLETAATVIVEVVDERGEPVSGVSVFARDDAGRSVDRMSTVRTDANGQGRYGGLSAGRYSFSARKDGLATGESAKVEVREGQEPRVRVALAPGTTLVVTTVDSNDAAVRAEVRVLDEGGRDVAGLMSMQDMMGRVARAGPGGNQQKIGPLPPGKYKVTATASDGRSIDKSVTLSGTAERTMTLVLGG